MPGRHCAVGNAIRFETPSERDNALTTTQPDRQCWSRGYRVLRYERSCCRAISCTEQVCSNTRLLSRTIFSDNTYLICTKCVCLYSATRAIKALRFNALPANRVAFPNISGRWVLVLVTLTHQRELKTDRILTKSTTRIYHGLSKQNQAATSRIKKYQNYARSGTANTRTYYREYKLLNGITNIRTHNVKSKLLVATHIYGHITTNRNC